MLQSSKLSNSCCRQDPRRREATRQPNYQSRMNQQPRQETASVPLYDQRQQPAYKQRDADGGFGSPMDSKVTADGALPFLSVLSSG